MIEICTELTGNSAAVAALREDVHIAARCDAKVLITGESGTGKEVTARMLHARGARRAQPFIALNCAGLAESLLESELFGHERGSFTGAVRDRAGLLEASNRGTAFLDEVGEMSARMQGMLLRFLETGEIQRVGSDRRLSRLDVRIITATNRDLVKSVDAGEFRLDLFYRLNVIHLRMPSLRERRDDIPVLVNQFLDQYSRTYGVTPPQISIEAYRMLQAYDWPGNVRELKNAVERLVVTHAGRRVEPDEVRLARPALDIVRAGRHQIAALDLTQSSPADRASALVARMTENGESFWSVVYEPFMARDLTRDDIRAVIRRGLEESRGSYKVLLRLFHVEDHDYKRILNFLRKHQCHVAFQPYRTVAPRPDSPTRTQVAS